MKRLQKIFAVMGLAFLTFWFFQMFKHADGTFAAMENAKLKYQIWALVGIACFWVVPLIKWFQNGRKIDVREIKHSVLDSVFPSFGRAVPFFIQCIRLVCAALFLFSTISSVEMIDEEPVISLGTLWLTIISGALFFGLPFFFPAKEKNNA